MVHMRTGVVVVVWVIFCFLWIVPVVVTANDADESIIITRVFDPNVELIDSDNQTEPSSQIITSAPRDTSTDSLIILAGSISGLLLISVLILIITIFVLISRMKNGDPIYYQKTVPPSEVIRLTDIEHPSTQSQRTTISSTTPYKPTPHPPQTNHPEPPSSAQTPTKTTTSTRSALQPVDHYIIRRLKLGHQCNLISKTLTDAGYTQDQIRRAYLRITTNKLRKSGAL